jgi:hypothetical protein
VAEPTVYSCRFFPSSARNAKARSLGAKLKTYRVPVTWWSYADDRLDARCPAVKSEALVEVKAYDGKEARQLVFREWGDHGTVGNPDPREVS